jgi:chromosomal replication initiator protein
MAGRDYEAFWNEARDRIRDAITTQEYDTWLRNMEYSDSDSGVIKLAVPSTFHRDQVAQRFQPAIERELSELSAQPVKLALVVANGGRHLAVPVNAAPRPQRLAPAEVAPAAEPPAHVPHSQLNPDYTFDRLVEGESNSLALNAAVAIAKNPGRAYNPCLVYGGVGLGKTHLLQAVGNAVYASRRDLKVVYVTVETFTNEFIQSIKEKTGHRFKNRYRSADLLLIDDIQFICDKESTQEEFLHTLNALLDHRCQVVVSGDRSPAQLDGMGERLRSRLAGGLAVDILPATYELRLGILREKAGPLGIADAPREVLEFLARQITSNVRELEMALHRIAAHAALLGGAITLQTTQAVLRDVLGAKERRITIEDIQRRVAAHYNIKTAEMVSSRRARAVVGPRHVAMYLAKQLTTRSLPEIGRKFGGRDHTTVMYGIRRIEERRPKEPALDEDLDRLRRSLEDPER